MLSKNGSLETSTENKRLRSKLSESQAEVKRLKEELKQALAEKKEIAGQLAKAKERIAELEAERKKLGEEMASLKQAPFKKKKRKGQPKEGTKPKKRGRKKGHKGSGRSKPERVDFTEFISAGESCPDCGRELKGQGVQRERFVEDIEAVRPTIVTRYIIERRWCPECRSYKESPVSSALPKHRLGLRTMLFVVYQKVALGLSYRKIKKELALYFGLSLSTATLSVMVAEVAHLFGPAYARLIKLMRQQGAIHIDETSWPIDGQLHWLWIFVNDVVSLYLISRSRGSKVPKALLGTEFEGTIISDFFAAYSPLEVQKAKCWAHLLRDSHDLTKGQSPDPEGLVFHHDLHALFVEMGLALEQVAADETQRPEVHQQMRTKLLALAQKDWQTPDCQRLAKRISKYLDELLLWLLDPQVAPDNNLAERGLRPAVVTRKTSFGSRSKQGAQAFARLLSLIRSWEAQGRDFFSMATSVLSSS